MAVATDKINPNSVSAAKKRHTKTNEIGKLISFPSKPHPHGMLLVFKKYKYRSIDEGYSLLRSSLRTGQGRSAGIELAGQSAIQLPFPLGLVDNTSLRINNFQRDPITESITNAAKPFLEGSKSMTVGGLLSAGKQGLVNAGVNAANIDTSDVSNTIGGLGSGLMDVGKAFLDTDISKLAGAAAYFLRSNLPGDMASQVDAVLGQAINPREALAFQGVDMKNHTFEWEMYPSNRTDSLNIRNIVNMLKINSLPVTEDLALGQGNDQKVLVAEAFLKYPAVVDIYLLGVNESYFMPFKTCMVTNFTVNYGASETGMLEGGKPVAVSLGINLAELAIHTANDYLDETDAPTTQSTQTTGEEATNNADAADPNRTGPQ